MGYALTMVVVPFDLSEIIIKKNPKKMKNKLNYMIETHLVGSLISITRYF
jgi:hypothetical protein